MEGRNCKDFFYYISVQCPNLTLTAWLRLLHNYNTYSTIAPMQTGIFLIYQVQFAQLALRTREHTLLSVWITFPLNSVVLAPDILLYPKLRDKDETLSARPVMKHVFGVCRPNATSTEVQRLCSRWFSRSRIWLWSSHRNCKSPISWDPFLAYADSGLAVLSNWQTGMSELNLRP